MKEFKIELNFVKNLTGVKYDLEVPIILEHKINEPVGMCEIRRSSDGNYVGYIKSDIDIDENLYFYYINTHDKENIIYISGLQLLSIPLKGSPALQVKQKII